MALEMRTECERCGAALGHMTDATICSHECTWCRNCAEELAYICPNCQGDLQTRPTRKDNA